MLCLLRSCLYWLILFIYSEVVMTFGRSRTVQEFLKAAARKRKFEVVVAESGTSLEGQQAALELSQAGISTTLITDAAVS